MRITRERGPIRSLRSRCVALAAVTVAALLSPLSTTSGNAAMVGSCGGAVPIPGRTSLDEGKVEGTRFAHVLVERAGVKLAAQLTVDAVTPRRYASTSSLPAPKPKIAAGTVVDSYLLHSDPVGHSLLGGNHFALQVSFDTNILGVIVADGSLIGSDAAVGIPGVPYSVFANRGLELQPFGDSLTIVDRHTVRMFFNTSTYLDDVRIVVAHSAVPGFAQAYGLTNNAGQVATFGASRAVLGNAPANLVSPVNAASETCTAQGYWLGASDGGIFSFGDAKYFGSMGGTRLNQPIVAMTTTPTGQGYWMVAGDGGIFSFGDAEFFGSMGAARLNQPVVGMTATPTSHGYRMLASDGGIFSFGDAKFYGSMGGTKLNQPMVGMTATPTGQGYWMVASDGGIFGFGDAKFYGSMGGLQLTHPIVGMKATPDGRGYWLVASDGAVFQFGDAVLQGSGVGKLANVVKIF
jgi:hypothetical protein